MINMTDTVYLYDINNYIKYYSFYFYFTYGKNMGYSCIVTYMYFLVNLIGFFSFWSIVFLKKFFIFYFGKNKKIDIML